MHSSDVIRFSIVRWRAARQVVLGAILLAGSVVTSVAVLYQMAGLDGSLGSRVAREYVYSGIGVVLERDGNDVIVDRVFPNSPAATGLSAGAQLLAVDGTQPETLRGWATAIRGRPGTTVQLEVAFCRGGRKTIELTRQVIRTIEH